MSKDRRSKDQKRKAKLRERTKRLPPMMDLIYSGTKYQGGKWAEPMFYTEVAIYQTSIISKYQLTNEQVEQAFVELIQRLRDGLPPTLDPLKPDEPLIPYGPGTEVEYLIQHLRRLWSMLFEDYGKVAAKDLIGLLQTLLHSIEAHAWSRGAERGYVDFLEEFMEGVGVTATVHPDGKMAFDFEFTEQIALLYG